MHVIDQKVQYFPIPGSERPPEGRPVFVRIGLYMEFDDGHRVKAPDGREFIGRGTRVRFNFKHGTWSVQPPQHATQWRMGYVFDRAGNPSWEESRKITGMTMDVFKREYNTAFVRKCLNHMAMS